MPDLFDLPPKQKLKTAIDNEFVRRVGMIQELIMDTEGDISLSDVFSVTDISILIDFLCSYWSVFVLAQVYFIFHRVGLFVYFVYDFNNNNSIERIRLPIRL